MKKKIIAFLMAMAMGASMMAGCGNSKDSIPEADTTIIQKTTGAYADKKVGVSIADFDNEYSTLYRNELYTYLIGKGFAEENIIVMNSAGDQAKQSMQVKNFVVDHYDVIFVDPVNPGTANAITDSVVPAGIPLIYINHEPGKAEEDRWVKSQWNVTFVGSESAQAGRMQGKIISELGLKNVDFDGNGKVDYFMVQADQNIKEMKDRSESSVKFMKNKDLSVKCRQTIQANGDATQAQQLVTEALAKKDVKVDVIFCNDDTMALGALKAIEVSNRTVGKDILLVGADGSKEALVAVAEGNMTGTVYHDYMTEAHEAVDSAVRYLTGEANENINRCKYVQVTQKNAQSVLDSLNLGK